MTTQEYVAKILAAAPPLSERQKAALRELLRPVRLATDELGTLDAVKTESHFPR